MMIASLLTAAGFFNSMVYSFLCTSTWNTFLRTPLSCVQWCQYARKCVGDEMYEVMMKIAVEAKGKKIR